MAATRQHSANFTAPWGRSVRIITFATLAFPLVMAGGMLLVTPPSERWVALLGPGALALIFGIVSLFGVRGYSLRQGDLWVRRLFWETRVPLEGLSRAWADSEAMRGAWRSAGNGGLFAYSGWFRNRKLGNFRVWVTDPKRSVVLEFEKGKTIVISPEPPKKFLRALGFDKKGRTTNP